MKLTVSSQELNKVLQLVSKILPTGNNPNFGILKYFLFEVEGNILTITASNLELTSRVKLTVDEADEDFKIAIEGERLLGLLRLIPDEPIILEVLQQNGPEEEVISNALFVKLSHTKGHYSLLADNADVYPAVSNLLEDDDKVKKILLPALALKRGLQSTYFAMMPESGERLHLAGVYFDLKGDKINIVATDTQRLATYTYNIETPLEEKGFIVPGRVINFLRALNVSYEGDVEILFDEKNVLFRFPENIEVISQLVEGNFPDYEKVMSFDVKYYVNIDRVEFINALKRVNLVSDKSSHFIGVDITNEDFIIKAKDNGLMVQGEEHLRADSNVEHYELGLNGKYLSDILNNIDSSVISLRLAEENIMPIRFEPFENEDENEKIEVILVGMKL